MEPLYRFKLNDNGQIETRVIDTYEETGAFFVYKLNSVTHWVSKRNLCSVFHNQVYTFNPDVNYARKIILKTLNDKADTLQRELDKVKDMIGKIEGRYICKAD